MTTSPLDLPVLKERAGLHEHYNRRHDMELPSSTVLALIAREEESDTAVLEEIGNRDHWMERFDALVYSLATIEEVGEWSSGNDIGERLEDHMAGKIQRLERRVEAAERVIAEVRALHQPKKIIQYNIPVFDEYDSPTVVHNGCTCGSYYYPCPSIKPLNGWS